MNDFDIFYHAALALLHGLSPYTVVGFFNPAWTLIPFIPLTLLRIDVAHVIWTILSLTGILVALVRWGLKPAYIAIIVLVSPPVWLNLIYSNVDWLVLLGATLAPKWGMWLLSMKPQVSIGTFVLRPRMLLIIVPAILLNYAILGLPRTMDTGVHAPADWFPWLVPLGIYLITRSGKTKSTRLALAAGAFLSPYYAITSYLVFAPLANTRKRLILLLVLSWILIPLWRWRIQF